MHLKSSCEAPWQKRTWSEQRRPGGCRGPFCSSPATSWVTSRSVWPRRSRSCSRRGTALQPSTSRCSASTPSKLGAPDSLGFPCRCTRRCALARSEEHTSELQSHVNLVCRLLLEKKKKKKITYH